MMNTLKAILMHPVGLNYLTFGEQTISKVFHNWSIFLFIISYIVVSVLHMPFVGALIAFPSIFIYVCIAWTHLLDGGGDLSVKDKVREKIISEAKKAFDSDRKPDVYRALVPSLFSKEEFELLTNRQMKWIEKQTVKQLDKHMSHYNKTCGRNNKRKIESSFQIDEKMSEIRRFKKENALLEDARNKLSQVKDLTELEKFQQNLDTTFESAQFEKQL